MNFIISFCTYIVATECAVLKCCVVYGMSHYVVSGAHTKQSE